MSKHKGVVLNMDSPIRAWFTFNPFTHTFALYQNTWCPEVNVFVCSVYIVYLSKQGSAMENSKE